MSNSKGRFVWYELMTSDMKAAQKFYADVVGWNAKDMEMPDEAYTMFNVGEAPVAGLMNIPEEAAKTGAQPGWVGYVAVDDVDAAAKQVADSGGAIHHAPTDIPNIGRFAVAADPQGSAFALFTGSGEAPPAPPPGTPGYAGWHELMANDWEGVFDFYAGLFGWSKGDAMDMGPMGTYQTFGANGGDPIGGMMNKPDEVPMPHWRYFFNVEAIDAAKDRLEAGGGKALMDPMEVPGGSWVVSALDPQGAEFALLAPKR